MKIVNRHFHGVIRRLSTVLIFILVTVSFRSPAWAGSSDISASAPVAAMKLVQFCINPKTGLDPQAVTTLADYVLSSKSKRETALPQFQDSSGAYSEFDTRITFPNLLEYSYNPLIPSALTRPSSMRYSLWTGPQGESKNMPDISKMPAAAEPVVIHGLQRDSNTPDLTTGVYHEYDLKRTLILFNHKGRRSLLSISKQIRPSDVGKKGAILGNDDQWNYYYSGEPGSSMTGLGWVKSYIYDYFSVIVYVDSGGSPATVRTGVFQWLRAGWSGINFVKTGHILDGMKRFARDSKAILEAPNLPAPVQVVSAYQRLLGLPHPDLTEKYIALRLAQQSSALQAGKITTKEVKKQDFSAKVPREQMLEELMVEYLKTTLGKHS